MEVTVFMGCLWKVLQRDEGYERTGTLPEQTSRPHFSWTCGAGQYTGSLWAQRAPFTNAEAGTSADPWGGFLRERVGGGTEL